jgi:hypothetical protein
MPAGLPATAPTGAVVLAGARKALAGYVRSKLGTDTVDLFAQVAGEPGEEGQRAIPAQRDQGASSLSARGSAAVSAGREDQAVGWDLAVPCAQP